jgi:hypothetical protein
MIIYIFLDLFEILLKMLIIINLKKYLKIIELLFYK